jgi:RNA methyltransferase, TrmH family
MLTKAEIARLRSLHQKKHREALGLFVVEGEKVVGEMLTAGFPFLEIYRAEESSPTRATTVPAAEVSLTISRAEMQRISQLPTPSPVLAVGQLGRRELAPDEINHGLTLALDGVQDAGNVGTLLRIADWFKLDRVVLSPDCADLFSQKVINASMGSFSRVPVHTVALEAALSAARVPILGSDLQGRTVHTLGPHKDAVLIVGSEGRGISPEARRYVTAFVTIPRYGAAESLNAAVAAAIICDNLRRVLG